MRISENNFFLFDNSIQINIQYYTKVFLSYIYDKLYYIIIKLNELINKKNTQKKQYNLSVCAIFKDEADSLKEWIDFHLIVGVEHFFLYNNFSNDNFLSILDPYINKGIVTLYDWPYIKGQTKAYKDCFERNKHLTQWLAFIDIDEFICPKKESTISEWLIKYKSYPSIVIYWKMFGTSGKIEHNHNIPVIEQYINSWEKLVNIGKTIVSTNYNIFDYNDFHKLSTVINIFGKRIVIPSVNEFKKHLRYGINRVGFNKPIDSKIQINHYWSKSYNTYFMSKAKRGPGTTNKVRDNDYLFLHELKNISSDYTIWRFLVKLKTFENEVES